MIKQKYKKWCGYIEKLWCRWRVAGWHGVGGGGDDNGKYIM